MNVSGIGATPPQPPLPPVAPVTAATSPPPAEHRPSGEGRPGQSGEPGRQPGHDAARPEPPRAEAPPLRMLTVTEMRVMLGQLPVSAGLKPPHRDADPTAAA